MAVPDGRRFPMEFDEVFPEGASVVGKAMAVRESQSPDDTVRNRPVMLDGVTVQPRAEMSGQAKWSTWVVRVTGMRAVGERACGKGTLVKPARVGSADTSSATA